eukprot:2210923-Prymnesium_polylepis.1
MSLEFIGAAESNEKDRLTKAAAGKRPVEACLKRAKRKLIIASDGKSKSWVPSNDTKPGSIYSYTPAELERERYMQKQETKVLYQLCEVGRENRALAEEARSRLPEARNALTAA